MMLFDRTDRGLLARWWWTIDRSLLGVFALLFLGGLLMVFASSPPVAIRLGLPSWHFVGRHMIYLLPAAILLIGCSLLSPRGVYRAAVGLLALSLSLMVLALFAGAETHGATRWVSFGRFAVQPGEFAKPALVVVSAAILARAPAAR